MFNFKPIFVFLGTEIISSPCLLTEVCKQLKSNYNPCIWQNLEQKKNPKWNQIKGPNHGHYAELHKELIQKKLAGLFTFQISYNKTKCNLF